MLDTLIVYSKNGCAQCGGTKMFLDSKGIPYEERNTSTNPDWLEEALATGLTSMPIVVPPVGDPFAGFRPELLAELPEA